MVLRCLPWWQWRSGRRPWRWKQQPANAGHLYVGGLFAFARHINYFGEILTFLGWALLTLSPAATAILTEAIQNSFSDLCQQVRAR